MEINREILKLARDSRGLSQKDLSLKLGIKQGTLSKIENEFLSIDEDLVDSFSQALNYPKSFFYQKKDVHLVSGHYRKKITLPQKEVRMQQSKMTILEWHLEKLISSIELPEANLPKWNCNFDGSPEICANYIREFWKIPRGRIENLTKLIEDNGIVVIPMDLGTLDGLSIFSQSGIPVIFVNRIMSGDRHRFNLAHELGHLIMHFAQKIDESRDVEDEAHLFASELLIPSREIKPHLVRINIEKLAELKRYWKVSMQAILVKSYKQLSLLTQNQYHYLWKQMSFLGYRKKEPVFIPVEKAQLVREIIELHLNDLEYSKSELSILLNITEREFDKLYLDESSNLRVLV